MEINITKFFNDADPSTYSASVAELGANAGKVTWNAAKDDAKRYRMLKTKEAYDVFKEYVKGFGAWTEGEIAQWSKQELNALFIQMVSGNMREVPDVIMGPDMTDEDWNTYQRYVEEGACSGNIFRGTDGQIYFMME